MNIGAVSEKVNGNGTVSMKTPVHNGMKKGRSTEHKVTKRKVLPKAEFQSYLQHCLNHINELESKLNQSVNQEVTAHISKHKRAIDEVHEHIGSFENKLDLHGSGNIGKELEKKRALNNLFGFFPVSR
jgi:uncharacterized protein YcaQ